MKIHSGLCATGCTTLRLALVRTWLVPGLVLLSVTCSDLLLDTPLSKMLPALTIA